MTTTPAAPSAPSEPDVEIDLTDLSGLLERRHAMRFSHEHIVAWLRSSGGTLTEQMMKHAAADALERSVSTPVDLRA